MEGMDNTIDRILIEDDNPTDEQLTQAFEDAKDEFGGVHTDYESEEFTTEFADQLNRILNEEAIRGLIDKGLAEPMVREDGEIGYNLTGLGERVVEASRQQ